MAPTPRPLEERFAERYVVDETTGCWNWTGGIQKTGYGSICLYGSEAELAHRASVLIHGREIPEGHQVHHVCENKACVNPDHLEVLSPGEHRAEHRLEMCKAGLHPMEGSNLKEYWCATRGQWNRYCHACRMDYQRKRRARGRSTAGNSAAA